MAMWRSNYSSDFGAASDAAPSSVVKRFVVDASIIVVVSGLFLMVRLLSHALVVRCLLQYGTPSHSGDDAGDRFIRRISEVPVCGTLSVCFAALGTMMLTTEDVLTSPFSMWDPVYEYFIAAFMGHLSAQVFVTSSDFPLLNWRFRLETVCYILAFLSYCIILVYQQDVILAIIGMIAQFPTMLSQFSLVIIPCACRKMFILNNILWLLATVALSGVVPVTLLVIANSNESMITMDPVPFIGLWTTVTFFTIAYINGIRVALTNLCEHSRGQRESHSLNSERSPILKSPSSNTPPIYNSLSYDNI